MPPTEHLGGHCEDEITPSNVQQLANAVRAMLRNGIINNANRVLLDPIDPYAGTPVPYLPNLRDLLRRTTGIDDIASITELKLRVITREAGLQHLSVHTPNLMELTLDGSIVSSLRDLGCRLHSLKVLKVNRCKLKCLDGLNGLRHIEQLYAAHNKLTDLTPCASLEFVRHIDVAGNLIEDLNVVGFLVLCGNLQHLVMDQNFGLSDSATYREDVRRFIPQLISLDGVEYADPPGRPHHSLPGRDGIEDEEENARNGLAPSAETAPSSSNTGGCYTVSFSPKVLSPRNEESSTTSNEFQVNTSQQPKM